MQIVRQMMMSLLVIFFCCVTVIHANLPKKYETTISELVSANPRQLSIKEYSAIACQVLKKQPCNLLIFGLGDDSALWTELNARGRTVFLEDNPERFTEICDKLPDIEAYLVQYETSLSEWQEFLTQPFVLQMPQYLLKVRWDIIFVDAPGGYHDDEPGRMQSIYTAFSLAKNNSRIDIFVHDCNRIVEEICCDKFSRPSSNYLSIDRLRHYYPATSKSNTHK